MDLQLDGRRALVSGGSRGIGFGIVACLAREGVQVVFCGRDAAHGEAQAQSLLAEKLDVQFIPADLASESGRVELLDDLDGIGPFDILINNMGAVRPDATGEAPFEDIPFLEWQNTVDRTLLSTVFLTTHLLPAMKAAGWGRVINISSVSGLEPGRTAPPDYAAAKAAINTLTVSLAANLTGTGVTANVIAPGPVISQTLQSYMEQHAAQNGWSGSWKEIEGRFITEVIPLKTNRIGRPEDIGVAVAFLASPLADFITGAHLRVDGGFSQAAI